MAAQRPMRCLLCISSLEGGGAERVMATLANELSACGETVALVTFLDPSPRDYAMAPGVERLTLGIGGGSPAVVASTRRNIMRIAGLTTIMRRWRPDVVLSFMEGANVVATVAAHVARRPVVVAERIDPREHRIGPSWTVLRRLTYPWADAVVVQTASVATGWAHTFLDPARVEVMPNPLSFPISTAPLRRADREPVVLAAGRLERQKGFDALIRAINRWSDAPPTGRLHIAGEGPERPALEALITELGIGDRVQLLGRVDDLRARMTRAACFVLSSRFEGFPNVLLEALACGTPVVSTDCRSGPADILLDSRAGILVPVDDEVGLARSIGAIVGAEDYAERAADAIAIASRYAGPISGARWRALLRRVAGLPAPSGS
jgi:GalNAc-alpha-(1->4)-GalNAc-alpha-(1->3)-diNAcBac-PP-undecaprenol alpha-1,4-N-acetyl-D-galactosaminyltransferase